MSAYLSVWSTDAGAEDDDDDKEEEEAVILKGAREPDTRNTFPDVINIFTCSFLFWDGDGRHL